MELQEEHPFCLCKKSPNSCIGGNFLPALTILVTLLKSTIVGHKSLDQALFKNNYAIKKNLFATGLALLPKALPFTKQ
jgi:hypothetical protein